MDRTLARVQAGHVVERRGARGAASVLDLVLQGFRMLLDPTARLRALHAREARRDWAVEAVEELDATLSAESAQRLHKLPSDLLQETILKAIDEVRQSPQSQQTRRSPDIYVSFVGGHRLGIIESKGSTDWQRTASLLRNWLDHEPGEPVALDLSDAPDEDSMRLVDFTAGLAFGRELWLRRIDMSRIFLVIDAGTTESRGSGKTFNVLKIAHHGNHAYDDAWEELWQDAERVGTAAG